MRHRRRSNRTGSIPVGVFILAACGGLIGRNTDSVPAMVTADVVNGLAVIGIAVRLCSPFRESDPVESVRIRKPELGRLSIPTDAAHRPPDQ